MGLMELYGVIGLVILMCMTMLWLISLILRNSSIVDILWPFGFVTAIWTTLRPPARLSRGSPSSARFPGGS